MEYEKKLIEGKFPCQQVGAETRRERDTGLAPPTHRLHIWWARRPLTPSRAAVLGSILPADVNPDEFLKELGIRKYQAKINGTWMDLPQSIVDGEGLPLFWSTKVEKAVNDENKLRLELKSICEKLIEQNPSFADDADFKVLLERTTHIDSMHFLEAGEIPTRLVSADPAWFNRIMGLCAEYNIRIPNLYGYDRAYKNMPSESFGNITVLDPTAGGGSIPFEAMRLGCKVIANDLNPVATAIEKASLHTFAE